MKPVPLTGDHEFTKHGREYLYHGIQLPATVTCLLLLVVAIGSAAVFYARGLRRLIAAIWLHAITAFAAVVIFSIWRFWSSIDVFI